MENPKEQMKLRKAQVVLQLDETQRKPKKGRKSNDPLKNIEGE